MRTTLTVDDDVFKQVEALAKRENRPRRELFNELLRLGIERRSHAQQISRRYQTAPRDLGRCLLPSLDDVAEALAVAEGDDFS